MGLIFAKISPACEQNQLAWQPKIALPHHEYCLVCRLTIKPGEETPGRGDILLSSFSSSLFSIFSFLSSLLSSLSPILSLLSPLLSSSSLLFPPPCSVSSSPSLLGLLPYGCSSSAHSFCHLSPSFLSQTLPMSVQTSTSRGWCSSSQCQTRQFGKMTGWAAIGPD